MNIAVDASCLLVNPYSGLSEVVHNLLLNMPAIDSNLKFTVFLNYFRRHEGREFHQYQNAEINSLNIPRRVIELLCKIDQFPFEIFLKDTDIFHSLYIPVPPLKKAKNILTIHDCRYFAVPQLYRHKDSKKYRRLMELSINRVDHIAAVSEFTKKEVLKYFSFPEERIKVIHNGFSQRKPDEKIGYRANRWFEKNKLDQPYLLYTGALDPRKNLIRLVEAIALCRTKSRDFPLLVVAGIQKKKWIKNAVSDKAKRLGINNSIYICGEVENELMPWLIKNSYASCYLSLYEGFGFPPLEAMSLGVPVIAGNSSSIPEVTGKAACLVNPNSIDEISRGLNEIVYNKNYRQKLIKEGYKQTKKFSWEKASEKYVDLYKMVGGL
jgi:glycosyltransferase involved in cell wall biosynthesis